MINYYQSESDGILTTLTRSRVGERFIPTPSNIDTDELRSVILSSDLSQKLVNQDTLGLYIIGSRGVGVNNSKSDFDIVAITKDSSKTTSNHRLNLSYKGVMIHGGFEYNYSTIWKRMLRFTATSVYPLHLPLTNLILYERGSLANYIRDNKDSLANLGSRIILDSAKRDHKRELGLLSAWTKNKYNLILASQVYTGNLDLDYVRDIKERCENNKMRNPERREIDLKILEIMDSVDQDKLDKDILFFNKEISLVVEADLI